MKFKQRIAVTKRGYGVLKRYCPGLIRTKVISALIETLSPFVTIWFSAQIINEIAGNRNTGTLILLVLLAVGLGFAFSMIRNALDRVIKEKEAGMSNDSGLACAEKQSHHRSGPRLAHRDRRYTFKNSGRKSRKTCSCSATALPS